MQMQILCFYHGFHILYSYCLVCSIVYMVEEVKGDGGGGGGKEMEVVEEMSYY